MSFFKMDNTKVSTGGGLIKEGEYEVIITNAESKAAKTSGKPMITVSYEVRSDVEQEFQGWKLDYNNFIIEADNSFTNTLLHSCGWDEKDNPPNFADLKDMAQQLVGKTLVVTVKHEEYVKDGEKRKTGKARFTSRSKLNQPASNASNGPIEVSEDDLPF